MPSAQLVDFDYHSFLAMLRRASDTGKRVDKQDPRWAEFIKRHAINEVVAAAIARGKYENIVAVILAEERDTDGLYFYSKDEEACMRLVSTG